MSDGAGLYGASVNQAAASYLEFSKTDFATFNSPSFSISADISAVNVSMYPTPIANQIIGAATGGMALTLPDKGWLAINVYDGTGNEVSGVTLTSTPAQSGGGALFCNGTPNGTNVTDATPPCIPARIGPMYLAYFDNSVDVSVTATGSSDVVAAPVRVGEITVMEFRPMVPPPTGGGGGVSTGTLSVNTEAGGIVTSFPNILTCVGPATCEAQVPLGTVMTLIATPTPGNEFEEWDGACDSESGNSSGGTCVRTVMSFNSIKAEFDPAP